MTGDAPRTYWTTGTTSTSAADSNQMQFYGQYTELVSEPVFSAELFDWNKIINKKELDGWDPETNQEEL